MITTMFENRQQPTIVLVRYDINIKEITNTIWVLFIFDIIEKNFIVKRYTRIAQDACMSYILLVQQLKLCS